MCVCVCVCVCVCQQEGQWRPTSNGRNSAMLHDVRAFAQQLKAIMKEVKDLSTAMDSKCTVQLNQRITCTQEIDNQQPWAASVHGSCVAEVHSLPCI